MDAGWSWVNAPAPEGGAGAGAPPSSEDAPAQGSAPAPTPPTDATSSTWSWIDADADDPNTAKAIEAQEKGELFGSIATDVEWHRDKQEGAEICAGDEVFLRARDVHAEELAAICDSGAYTGEGCKLVCQPGA